MSETEVKRMPVEVAISRGGKWVILGGVQLLIPPLGFRAVQDLQERVAGLRDMGAKPTADQMQTVAEIVHAAIKRNYTTIDVDTVFDLLDLGNYQAVLGAVLNVAGFEKSADAGEPSGEASASIGTASTAA